MSSSPSSVFRLSVVPSAADVIGSVTRQCRSSPSRVKTSCGRSWISTYRSPAGPPPGPTSPWPVSRIRMPSSTPAGTFTWIVRRERTRPSPAHSRARLGDDLAGAGAGRADCGWRRPGRGSPRWTLCTSPRPEQVVQVVACVPGAVPAPVQMLQRTAVSTVMSLVVPNTVSSSSSSTGMSASRPARVRLRGPRVAAPPKNASMMSPSPPKPAPPKPPAPRRRRSSNGSPPRSTMRRFSGSVSAS